MRRLRVPKTWDDVSDRFLVGWFVAGLAAAVSWGLSEASGWAVASAILLPLAAGLLEILALTIVTYAFMRPRG